MNHILFVSAIIGGAFWLGYEIWPTYTAGWLASFLASYILHCYEDHKRDRRPDRALHLFGPPTDDI